MGKEKQEIKEITSKIFEQKRQLVVKIPAEIIEDFRIDPDRYDFGWTILEDNGRVTINGRFILKVKDEKKN